ncbi:MAG: hypothetical protein PHH98_01435 [Candidatus Gracilibacteria bacterium]|nr:hypothetical protein [Candidatus Gracilibacteria bacterium]
MNEVSPLNTELESVIDTSEYYNNQLVNIKTTKNFLGKQIKYFFYNEMSVLLGFIELNILNSESGKNIITITEITSASGYRYLSDSAKKNYDENGYEDGQFIKGKAAGFLSFVIKYINQNFGSNKEILVICKEKNESNLKPVIESIKNLVGNIIDNISEGGQKASFIIKLK